MPFKEFERVPPDVEFSKEFFHALTFKSVSSIRFPRIAPPSSLTTWFHVANAPEGPDAYKFSADEVVPHIDDLLEITASLEAGFSSGSRAVFMTLRVDGRNVTYTVHYAKVRPAYLSNG